MKTTILIFGLLAAVYLSAVFLAGPKIYNSLYPQNTNHHAK